MTAALTDVDAHAQTDGSELPDLPIPDTKLSSQRAPKKLAIGLMSFLKRNMTTPYEMDLSHAQRGL
ncbi:hypothetical protein DOZ80_11005 [Pseudomonas fluorescens]|uniref:Uncharacterized protein n=1 Tax=Pseudomonas fluorescens TaxID=294 RepID=A0A327N7K7_PSEFL|nr:hypothetical protein DOZ80_11005 [Pseudomonas fluorescens]